MRNGQVNLKYTFEITPVPQGRPRFVKRGNFVQAYDPKTSKEFKEKLKELALQQSPALSERALEVSIVFYMSIPKSKPKKWRESPPAHVVKGDIDNVIKGTLDALTGILWKDDSQICMLSAHKVYSNSPRIEMVIREVEDKRMSEYMWEQERLCWKDDEWLWNTKEDE